MPYTWLPSAYIYGFMGAHFSIQLALFLGSGPVFLPSLFNRLFKILFHHIFYLLSHTH